MTQALPPHALHSTSTTRPLALACHGLGLQLGVAEAVKRAWMIPILWLLNSMKGPPAHCRHSAANEAAELIG